LSDSPVPTMVCLNSPRVIQMDGLYELSISAAVLSNGNEMTCDLVFNS
jgi:hypothetical protein